MEKHIEIVKRFYQELDDSNFPGATKLLDEEFMLIQAESLPYGGKYAGVTEIQEFFGKFFAFWKSFTVV